MNHLYPAERHTKHNFAGKLLIDGDLEDNCILFRFLFDTAEMVHPLILWVRVLPIALLESCSEEHHKQGEKIFVFACNIPDYINQVMKTELIFPDFLLKEYDIKVIKIDSQVSCYLCES